jgi:hypothetical protein
MIVIHPVLSNVQPLSADLNNQIIAGHLQQKDHVFSPVGFPCSTGHQQSVH